MNVLATPRARSDRDDFRPTGKAPTTMQYSRDLGGRDSRCDSRDGIINPSNCHSRVTPRGKCVFLLDSVLLPLPSLHPLTPMLFQPSGTQTRAFLQHRAASCVAFRSREREPSREERTNRRRLSGTEDKPCLLQGSKGRERERGGGMEGRNRTGKRRDRASGRDSVTHSVDRCRIVYLISGIINQEVQLTLKRNEFNRRRRSSFTK